MRKLITSAIAMVSAGSAMAGSVAYTPPAATIIVEPQRMGGSGAWLVPLIILAVIGLAISNNGTATPVTGNRR